MTPSKQKTISGSVLPVVAVVGITIILLVPLFFLFGGMGNSDSGGTSEAYAANPAFPEDARMISSLSAYSGIKLDKEYSEKKKQLMDLKAEIDSYNDKIKADPLIDQAIKDRVDKKANEANIVINKLIASFPAQGQANKSTADISSLLTSLNNYRREIRVAVKCRNSALASCIVRKAREIVDISVNNETIFDISRAQESNAYFISVVLQRAGIFEKGASLNMAQFSNLKKDLGLEYVLGSGMGEILSKDEVKDKLLPGDIILSVDDKDRRHLVLCLDTVFGEKSGAHWSLVNNKQKLGYTSIDHRLSRSDIEILAIIRAKN